MDILPISVPLDLPASLDMLKFLLVISFLLHIIFINFMIGGTFWAVFFRMLRKEDPFYDRLARDMISTVTVNKSVAVVVGVAPLLTISLSYIHFFYAANNITAPFWLSVIWLVALAFLTLYFYKYTWDSEKYSMNVKYLSGLSAFGIFLFVPFIFLTNINTMLYPDQWKNIYNFWGAIWVPNVIPRYLHFLNASFAVTGFFAYGYFHFRGKNKPQDAAYYDRAKRLGLKWALAATLLQMIFGVLNYVTLPVIGDSNLVLILIIIAVIFAGVATYLISLNLFANKHINPYFIFGTIAVTLILMATLRHVVRENALNEPMKIVANKTGAYQARLASFMKTYSPTSEIVITGETVFHEVCTACHAIDKPIVGPPMTYAIEKYKGDPEAMKEFVANPQKINPEYPVMPKPPISQTEVDLVVDYLLSLEVGQNEN